MAPRRATLTTRGVVALAVAPVSALAGALLGAEELVLLAIALCLLLAAGLVQCASRAGRDLDVWRVGVDLAASDVEVGGLLTVRVIVGASDHGGSTPVWLEAPERGWEPAGAGAAAGAGAVLAGGRRSLPNPALVRRVSPLESGATASFSSVAPTWSRGVFSLPPLRLWCVDSFGLVARLVASGPRATVTVYPAPIWVDLDEDLLRGETGAEESQSPTSVARRGHDSLGDFSGIRPYIPGDRLRLLYWPALALHDELMVRDFEDSGSHRVRVVADIRRLIGAPGCESVLATVAGVGLAALDRGSVVELSTTAGERMTIEPGPHAPLALLRAVANVEVAAPVPPRGLRRRTTRTGTGAGSGTGAGGDAAERELARVVGTQLVVTTEDGARTMAGPFGFAHLVIAP
jgi:uncharacterized protein (DUF58 family)